MERARKYRGRGYFVEHSVALDAESEIRNGIDDPEWMMGNRSGFYSPVPSRTSIATTSTSKGFWHATLERLGLIYLEAEIGDHAVGV